MPKVARKQVDTVPGRCVETTLALIDGKWKGLLLFHLLGGELRFSEIRRLMPNVTQRMLTPQLRAMEADDLIKRTIFPQVPPKVEYCLTDRGRSLEPIIVALRDWGWANAALEHREMACAEVQPTDWRTDSSKLITSKGS